MAACNKRGCRSGSIFGPLTAAAPPDQPEPPLATATAASPAVINLTWTPPDNGGMPILRTELQRDDGQELGMLGMGWMMLGVIIFWRFSMGFSTDTVWMGGTGRR